MINRTSIIRTALGLAVVLLAIEVAVERNRVVALRSVNKQLHERMRLLNASRKKNERLKKLQANAEELERGRRENRELLKLRGEVGRLQTEISELRKAAWSSAPETVEPQAGFRFTTNEGTITFTEYSGSDDAVTIPGTINGLPVTSIGVMAFANCTNVSSVTIPDSITNIDEMAFDNSGLTNVVIGKSIARIKSGTFSCASTLARVKIPASVRAIDGHAFSYCTNLSAVFFDGDAPQVEPSAFSQDKQATIYYRQGTDGWGPTYAGCPTALLEQ